MSVEFRESEAPAGWDELVRSAIGGSYFQSSLYGRFLQGYEGSTPLYWIVREGENVAALLLARIVARGLNLLKTATICWECGPVVLAREGADEATQKILDAVVSFAEQRGFRKIGPTTPAYHDHELCTEVEDLMADRGFRSCKGATLIIDGSNGEEACWSALERSARKAVRKARKNGVVVKPVEPGSMTGSVVELYNQCRARLGLSLLNLSYADIFDDVFEGEDATFYMSYRENIPTAVLGCITFGRVASEFMAGQTDIDINESLCGNDLIRWEIIRECARKGVRYDQSGVALDPKSPKEERIRRFKHKWGGELVKHNIWSHRRQYFRPRFEMLVTSRVEAPS